MGKQQRTTGKQQQQKPQQVEASQQQRAELQELEQKRGQVAAELRQVEEQIYDLETTYLAQSNPMGNAIRGYEGFLGGQKKGAPAIDESDRLFSWSSVTGQLHVQGQR
eukprot:scaffold14.g1335.t1